MENTQKLINFLNIFCENYQANYDGCNDCPNYAECNTELWENADAELNEFNVKVLEK